MTLTSTDIADLISPHLVMHFMQELKSNPSSYKSKRHYAKKAGNELNYIALGIAKDLLKLSEQE